MTEHTKALIVEAIRTAEEAKVAEEALSLDPATLDYLTVCGDDLIVLVGVIRFWFHWYGTGDGFVYTPASGVVQ